jgi:hypothetical protein
MERKTEVNKFEEKKEDNWNPLTSFEIFINNINHALQRFTFLGTHGKLVSVFMKPATLGFQRFSWQEE